MSNLTKSIPADERKMLRKAFWRSFTLDAAVSPAKQGASGFCYSLMHKKYVLFQYNHHLFHFHYGSCSFHGEEKQRAEGF